MIQDILHALGGSINYYDLRGDFSIARQLADGWLRKAASTERSTAAATQAILFYLQGNNKEALRLLAKVEAGESTNPDFLLLIHSWRRFILLDRYNTFPDAGVASGLELSARWQESIQLPKFHEHWQKLYRQSSDPSIQWDAQYIFYFLGNLRSARYTLNSTRFAPADFDIDEYLTGQLQFIENYAEIGKQGGSAVNGLYALQSGADLHFRCGKRAKGFEWLDRAARYAEAAGDEHGMGWIALSRGDHLSAPFSTPLSWNFAMMDSFSAGSHLAPNTEAAEFHRPTEKDLAIALESYRRAEGFFTAARAPRALAALRLRHAYLAVLDEEPAAAADQATKAAAQFRKAGDYKGEQLARTHYLMSLLLYEQRPPDESLATAIGRWGAENGSLAFTLGLGVILNRLARHLLLRRGDAERALNAYRAAAALHKALGAKINTAQNIVDRGVVLQAVGNLDGALNFYIQGGERYEEAIADYQESMPGIREVKGNIWQRRVFLATDAYRLAQQKMDHQAMDLFAGRLRQLTDNPPPQLLEITDQAPPAFGDDENLQMAEGSDYRSLQRMAEEIVQQAAILVPMYHARHLNRQGDERYALSEWQQVQSALQQMSLPSRHMYEAIVWSEIQEYDKAAASYRQYLQSMEDGWLHQMMETIKAAGGGFADKEVHLHQRRRHHQAFSMWVRLKQYPAAEKEIEALQQLDGPEWWRKDSRPWQLLSDCAEMYEGLDDPARALQHYDQAIREIESRRSRLSRDELKTAITNDRGVQYLYFQAARSAFRLRQHEQAFEYIEQGRARSLLDLMATSASDLPGGSRENESLRRWRQLNAQIALWRGLLARERSQQVPSAERIRQLEAQIDEDDEALQQLESRLADENPDFFRIIHREARSLTTREVSNCLTKDDLLLEYALLGEDLLVWIIDHRKLSAAHWFILDTESLERDILTLHRQYQHGGPYQVTLELLSDQLLKPIADALGERKHLYIVPYGAMHRLPFHTLELEGQPLGAQYQISYLPSASVLQYLSRAESPSKIRMLAVGNPTGDLHSAAAEALFVADLFGTDPLIGAEATEPAIRERLPSATHLHFATHGFADEASPLRSAILLADGEELSLYEMMGLHLRAELAVLSACETAIGETTRGDDVIGLTRGLLAAGARSALVTLWKVDDLSTSLFMRKFYRALKNGKPASRALQAAQQYLRQLTKEEIEVLIEEMNSNNRHQEVGIAVNQERKQRSIRLPSHSERIAGKDGTFSHPYYWAAFVLVGK